MGWHGELNDRAAGHVRTRPQRAAMPFDDRTADRQPHPQTGRLRGVEGRENVLGALRRKTGPRIAHCHEHAVRVGFARADEQLSRAIADAAHRLERVDDQVQEYLLQFDTVSFDEWQAVRELCPYRGAALRGFATRELDHLVDRLVDVHRLLARRRLPDQITDPAKYVPCPIGILDNFPERLLYLVDVRRLGVQPPQRRLGVGRRRGDRLVDFVGDRGCELPHGCDTVRVCQFRLHLAIALLAFAGFFLRLLALAQIEHESDTVLPACFGSGRTDHDGHTAAVLPEILLLERLRAPRPPALGEGPFAALTPLWRRQVPPVHPARDQILTLVSHHAKKSVIGLENLAAGIPD